MQYVAEVSGKGKDIDRVKEQLLQSNPVLEGITHCHPHSVNPLLKLEWILFWSCLSIHNIYISTASL